jgi:AhpD family alkylhydroperoxidase
MYRFAKRKFGEVPEPFTVAAHHPRLLAANAVHEMLLQGGSTKLPTSVRELGVFWTARTVGCAWCVDLGALLQRLDGLDVDRLKHIDEYATSPCSTPTSGGDRLRRRHDHRPAHRHRRAVADLRARFGDDGVSS